MWIPRVGGGPDEVIHSEPSHPDQIQRRAELRAQHSRGGFDPALKDHKPFILESFYYADADTERLIPRFGDFLLDSGAFTFMMNAKVRVNWEEYIERYADFIKRNNVKKYFELDIDSVVGFDKVLEYRRRLEKLTGSHCIPVWHRSRGIEQYKRDAEKYDYIAIGGVVPKEIKQNEYKAFPMMINIAHKNNAKVHCLGFTNLEGLTKYHFDSVDSTAWTTGNRFGYIYRFDGKTMKKIKVPAGKRIKEPRQAALINYTEWIKFQKYAKVHL